MCVGDVDVVCVCVCVMNEDLRMWCDDVVFCDDLWCDVDVDVDGM